MSEVTVKQLADVVKTPVEKLLVQLSEAGLEFSAEDQVVSDEQKMQLLDHLRNNRSQAVEAGAGEGKKITLRRKSTSTLKVGGSTGRNATTASTVNVEVRKKRTYVKRSVVLEEAAKEEQQRAEERATKEAEIAAKLEREAAEKEAQEKAKQEEVEKKQTPEQQAVEQDAIEQGAKEQDDQTEAVGIRVVTPAPEKTEEDKKPAGKDKKSGKPKRQELHVASDKRGKRKAKPKHRRPGKVAPSDKHQFEKPSEPVKREILVPESISVSDLAQKMAIKAAEVIGVMMKMGVMATINQILDQDTAILVVEEIGHEAKPMDEASVEAVSYTHLTLPTTPYV